MVRNKTIFILIFTFILLLFESALSQDELKVWKEFILILKKGEISQDKIQPHYGVDKGVLAGFIKTLSEKTAPEDYELLPEIFRVGNQVHYLITLHKVPFCFSLLIEGDKWYFQHMESIFIRLDKLDSIPISKFPDISEKQKEWAREEIYWYEKINLFRILSKEKEKEFVFNLFKDGAGYFLGARTWVPFVHPGKAFILYMCWEQANLRNNTVILEKLEDDEAIIRIYPIYFMLYKQSGIKSLINFEDYRKIFETIWQDRAMSAGWKLEITYNDIECIFKFQKEK